MIVAYMIVLFGILLVVSTASSSDAMIITLDNKVCFVYTYAGKDPPTWKKQGLFLFGKKSHTVTICAVFFSPLLVCVFIQLLSGHIPPNDPHIAVPFHCPYASSRGSGGGNGGMLESATRLVPVVSSTTRSGVLGGATTRCGLLLYSKDAEKATTRAHSTTADAINPGWRRMGVTDEKGVCCTTLLRFVHVAAPT